MKSTDFLISIDPPKKVSDKIHKLQKFIWKKTGKGSYIPDEPHITLYVNSTYSLNKLKKELSGIVKNHKPFEANIKKIHAFVNDPIFLSTTIVYRLNKSKEISSLQEEIVRKISPLRNKETEKWLFKMNPKVQLNYKRKIKKWGYPFNPKDWIFHASVTSLPKNIPKKEFDKIWKEIRKKFNMETKWQVNSFSLSIKPKRKPFRIVKRYKL